MDEQVDHARVSRICHVPYFNQASPYARLSLILLIRVMRLATGGMHQPGPYENRELGFYAARDHLTSAGLRITCRHTSPSFSPPLCVSEPCPADDGTVADAADDPIFLSIRHASAVVSVLLRPQEAC